MNEMEMQLSRLFNAAVGEPPNQVTAHAARRQALKRRIIACISATAALAIAGSIGLAVSAHAIVPHRVTSSHHKTVTRPKYYFDEDFISLRKNLVEDVIRSSVNGAIVARVRCPGPHTFVVGAAAADNETFFIECQHISNHRVTGFRLYRFRVTSAGRITGFGLIHGGNFLGLRGANMAASADGSELAVDVARAKSGPIFAVYVISTKTGSLSAWHAFPSSSDVLFHPMDLSFAQGGHELAVFGYDTCAAGVGSHCKGDPGQEMRVVSPAVKGGNLSSGRQIFVQSRFGGRGSYVQDAFITPDGATVIVGVRSDTDRIIQISAATGKKLRTLFSPGTSSRIRMFTVDQSGQFLLYNGLTENPIASKDAFVNGWIDHGRLRLLKPAHGYIQLLAW
jgi:hypothetical protein